MAGELVPLVMIPRYSTHMGEGDFYTAPMEVSAYEKAILAVWRGYVQGSAASPTPALWGISFEGSQDANTWTTITHSGALSPTGTGHAYGVLEMDLDWKWFRARVALVGNSAGTACAATSWAVGNFVRREA